jgi:hypothetical protein
VVSSGWCLWAEGIQYQHPGGEIIAIVPSAIDPNANFAEIDWNLKEVQNPGIARHHP